MPKITIDEKDYYTDDFNEDQMQMYNEIIVANNEIQRIEYVSRVLNERCTALANGIAKLAEESDVEEAAKEGDSD